MSRQQPLGWFPRAFGFEEFVSENGGVNNYGEGESNKINQVHTYITTHGSGDALYLKNKKTGQDIHIGAFSMPSLKELDELLNQLRSSAANSKDSESSSSSSYEPGGAGVIEGECGATFRHIIGDSGSLHRLSHYNHAFHQVASQFNCLEMPNPHTIPEAGVTDYVYDGTQGPACAMAAPWALLYRNYFVYDGKPQTATHQLNLLSDVQKAIDPEGKAFHYSNGYVFPSNDTALIRLKYDNREYLKSLLRVGIHWDTPVREVGYDAQQPQIPLENVRVGQVLCSALPISYDPTRSAAKDWEPLGRIVLEAQYEATLAAAAISARKAGKGVRRYVMLTKVGGGVFGNPHEWIIDAINRALKKYANEPIDVELVHFRVLTPSIYKTVGTNILLSQSTEPGPIKPNNDNSSSSTAEGERKYEERRGRHMSGL